MPLYPAWLDYASWTLIVIGIICFLDMLSEPAGRKRGYLKLSGCIILGLGAGLGAVTGILFNLRAPILKVQGALISVSHHGGKHSSTDFAIKIPTGEIDGLSISTDTQAISDTEIASVDYQQFSNRVVGLKIIAGTSAGYETTASNGLFGSWGLLVLSTILAGYGVLDWISDGTAVPSEKSDDNRTMPDGDVDTKSMLNLNQPD